MTQDRDFLIGTRGGGARDVGTLNPDVRTFFKQCFMNCSWLFLIFPDHDQHHFELLDGLYGMGFASGYNNHLSGSKS